MNHRISVAITIAGIALVGLVAWSAIAGDGADQDEAGNAVTSSSFNVTGMTCGGCEAGVRRVVKKLEGIEAVEASYKNGTATVDYQADKVTPDDIIAAIEKLGYTAELIEDDTEGA